MLLKRIDLGIGQAKQQKPDASDYDDEKQKTAQHVFILDKERLIMILRHLGCWSFALAFPFWLAIAARAEEPKKPWKNSTEASVVSANGNSHATTTSAKEDYAYEWNRYVLNLFGSALGSSDRTGATAEEYAAGEKVDFKLDPNNYLYERFKWDARRFSGIRHRYDGSGGYGRKLLALPKDQLNGEIGAGYLNEQRIDAPRNDFPSGRAYMKYVHQFSDTSSFSQDAEYIHNLNYYKDYRFNTETALTAGFSKHLSLKTSFVWNRVARPVPGNVKDDTKVSAALLITY
jgi:putative salt-induced outer membrane protein YdiY